MLIYAVWTTMNHAPLSIVPYTSDYLHDLALLYHAGFSGDDRGGVYTAEYFAEHIAYWMCDESCRCYIAWLPASDMSPARIVGYRIGYAHTKTMPDYFEELGCREEVEEVIHRSGVDSQGIFWLDDLVIDASFRSKGYGTRIIQQHVMPTALHLGYKTLFVYTLDGDEKLAKFYGRLGFLTIGTFLDHISGKKQVILMKELVAEESRSF